MNTQTEYWKTIIQKRTSEIENAINKYNRYKGLQSIFEGAYKVIGLLTASANLTSIVSQSNSCSATPTMAQYLSLAGITGVGAAQLIQRNYKPSENFNTLVLLKKEFESLYLQVCFHNPDMEYIKDKYESLVDQFNTCTNDNINNNNELELPHDEKKPKTEDV